VKIAREPYTKLDLVLILLRQILLLIFSVLLTWLPKLI